jgi:hypothetical protein
VLLGPPTGVAGGSINSIGIKFRINDFDKYFFYLFYLYIFLFIALKF